MVRKYINTRNVTYVFSRSGEYVEVGFVGGGKELPSPKEAERLIETMMSDKYVSIVRD